MSLEPEKNWRDQTQVVVMVAQLGPVSEKGCSSRRLKVKNTAATVVLSWHWLRVSSPIWNSKKLWQSDQKVHLHCCHCQWQTVISTDMEIDNVFHEIGESGRQQVKYVAVLCLLKVRKKAVYLWDWIICRPTPPGWSSSTHLWAGRPPSHAAEARRP